MGRLEVAAYQLAAPTVPPTVAGLPPAGPGLPVPQLRALMIRNSTPVEVKDQVWRYLVAQVRAHRGDWHLYTLGVLLPGLWKAALRLAPQPLTPPGRVRTVHTLITEECLFALHRIEATSPYLWKRLIDAAVYGTKVALGIRRRAADRQPDTLPIEALEAAQAAGSTGHTRLPRPAAGHPYQTLAALVRATAGRPAGQRLTPADARLIAHTYLDGYPLAQAAAWEHLSEPAARMRRWRAVQLIGRHLDHTRGQPGRPEHPGRPDDGTPAAPCGPEPGSNGPGGGRAR